MRKIALTIVTLAVLLPAGASRARSFRSSAAGAMTVSQFNRTGFQSFWDNLLAGEHSLEAVQQRQRQHRTELRRALKAAQRNLVSAQDELLIREDSTKAAADEVGGLLEIQQIRAPSNEFTQLMADSQERFATSLFALDAARRNVKRVESQIESLGAELGPESPSTEPAGK